VFCRILEKYSTQINTQFRKKIIDDGICIPAYGQKADEICNEAIEEFSAEAALPDNYDFIKSKDNEALFDKKVRAAECR
jgi:hypothetical protein